MFFSQIFFITSYIYLIVLVVSTAMDSKRRHTASDGTIREYNRKEKKWVVIESSNNNIEHELLFLPSREYNVDFASNGFLVNGLPVPVTAQGKSRHAEEEIDGDTGLTIWDGSILLARTLEASLGEPLKNKNVLELGSGVGVVGISAAALGANVVLTDLEYTRNQIEANIQRARALWGDKVHGKMHFKKLDWTTDFELYVNNNTVNNADVKQQSFLYYEHFDYILGADIIWLEPLIMPLLRMLDVITAVNKNCKVLISYQSRSKRADDLLFNGLQKIFQVDELEKLPKGYETEKIKIIVLHRLENVA